MGTTLAGLIERLVSLLKLQSTIPALIWMVVNRLIFEGYLESRQMIGWWLELTSGEKAALMIITAICLGYALDNLNFILLTWCESKNVQFAWAPNKPILELGVSMIEGNKRIKERYGITDAKFMWPHLSAILSKNGYAALIEREKVSLDFFLNLSFLSLVLVLESVVVHVLGWSGSFAVPWLGLGAMLLFYRLAIPSAEKWYDWVNAAFDLYRYELAEQLTLEPFANKGDEYFKWTAFSDFILQRDISPCFPDIHYSSLSNPEENDEKSQDSSSSSNPLCRLLTKKLNRQ